MLDIGEVVRVTGVPTSTLHVWEKRGLLQPAGRAGLRRQYAPETIERIAVILVCQKSGFTLAEIADLLRPDAFADGKGKLADKLIELHERRNDLDKAIAGIQHALDCSRPSPMDCPDFLAKLPSVFPSDP